MCGVFLIYSKNKKLSSSKCITALKTLSNRGPDRTYYNFFLDNRLFIGNSILQINGKAKKSRDLYNNKKFYLSYNGEIYNHKLIEKNILKKKMANDTGTLLNLHNHFSPQKVIKLLDGMFAYVLFNKETNNIHVVTDSQGEKKLLKYEDENYLIISSNQKPLINFLKEKLKINKDIINDYFNTRHFLQFKHCFFEKVKFIDGGNLNTINLNTGKLINKEIDNPINWINKKNYKKYASMSLDQVSIKFEKLMKKKLDLMKPQIDYGTIISGGIDSSLVSLFLQNDERHKLNICLVHKNKDIPANNVLNGKFKNFINYKKLKIFFVKPSDYFDNLRKTYKKYLSPLSSHDLPGRNLINNYFKKRKIKVIFPGDGADEIFGGYEVYKKINWNTKETKILSPYSLISNTKSKQYKDIKILFEKVYKKYRSFLSHKESLIQSNLYLDYFVQCVGVHNVSNDVMAGENSVEIRNIFLNKEIIKFAVNLPIKFKINLESKEEIYKLKPILKKIFIKNFGKKLYVKKQGFPGHPNEAQKFLNKNDKNIIKSFFKKTAYLKKTDLKSIKWKILNIFFVQKFLNKELHMGNQDII
tara:strand:+ start:372 stop:2126 length:1755 start_codon:yes stop_codon:yes gene_type:complete